MTAGTDAALRDLRIDGDADFAQAVSMLVKNLRWDVEEDLSRRISEIGSLSQVCSEIATACVCLTNI